jgi:signal transduction histidine kinase
MDLFQHFSEEELYTFFAENVEELRIAAGEYLCHEGSPGDDMFILLEGELKITKHTKFITTIKPVEYIGEMALIEAKPRSATVQAVTDSTLLRITRDQFRKYFSQTPESLFSMMRTLSHRIRLNTEIIAAELEKANILIHDMKNQMAPFLFLDLLEKKLTDESQLRLIKVMQSGRNKLAEMMAEALANAKRLDRPRKYEVGSLPDLVAELQESELKAHPDLKDRQVRFNFRNALPEVSFCRLEIYRVLTNLLINAAQASKVDQPIDVEVNHDDDNLIVMVKDRGEGIPERYRTSIFDSHFTTKAEGNGLGLASCRQIVEVLHGGRLSFSDRIEGGTIFTFTLPRHRPA